MKLENMLIDENTTIKDAVGRLERFRCKNVYVVVNMKLIASISDGDARRFLLKNGNIEDKVENIANYSPISFYENQIDDAKKYFRESEIQSIPILNFNDEVVSILFRNEALLSKGKNLKLPVVIMAGGKGTRLYPYTKILPKALIPIGEIPITEHIINRLYDCGCQNFYMIINHKKNMIRSYFESIHTEYQLTLIEEEKYLGTGGGLSLLKGKINECFILSNCDILVDIDYEKVYEYHAKNNNYITIVSACKQTKIPYGVIQLDREKQYKGVIEKPETSYLINTGFYIVNQEVLNDLKEDEVLGFPDIIEQNYRDGKKIGVYEISDKAFMDMGQLEELESMRLKLGV